MSQHLTPSLSVAPVETTCLPANFVNLTPRKQKELKASVKRWLAETQEGKQMVYIGVTRTIEFKDGTHQGALQPGRVYHCPWEEYEALKLDSIRSSYVLLLDPMPKTAVDIACMGMLKRIRTAK